MNTYQPNQPKNRLFPRTKIQLPVHYKFMEDGELFHALESTSNDIGAMGLGAKCDRHLPCGQHLMMNLYIPAEIRRRDQGREFFYENECQPVLILGELVWCQQNVENDYFIGVKFHQIESEHKRRFKNFLISKNIYHYHSTFA